MNKELEHTSFFCSEVENFYTEKFNHDLAINAYLNWHHKNIEVSTEPYSDCCEISHREICEAIRWYRLQLSLLRLDQCSKCSDQL